VWKPQVEACRHSSEHGAIYRSSYMRLCHVRIVLSCDTAYSSPAPLDRDLKMKIETCTTTWGILHTLGMGDGSGWGACERHTVACGSHVSTCVVWGGGEMSELR
jgi:hypothetical protein